MIALGLIACLSFLIWNVLNETAVLAFFNTKDIKYLKEWHTYDAILRSILLPIIIYLTVGLTLVAIKLIITIGLFYHFGFNLLINYWRKRKEFKSFNFKTKIDILLYLSDGAIIDSRIIRFSEWLSKKVNKPIDYRIINFIVILIEITIIIFIWL